MITFLKGKEGVSSIEYALIAMLIFLVIVGAVTLLSKNVLALFDYIAGQIQGAIGGP